MVDDALLEMDKQYWFLKSSGLEYYFDKDPQINKIIHDYKQEVDVKTDVRDKISSALESVLPETEGLKVVIWDKDRLEDNDSLKIFVLDYELRIGDENVADLVRPLLESNPNQSIRDYQNTIIFLYPDPYGIDSLVEKAKLCAQSRRHKRTKDTP